MVSVLKSKRIPLVGLKAYEEEQERIKKEDLKVSLVKEKLKAARGIEANVGNPMVIDAISSYPLSDVVISRFGTNRDILIDGFIPPSTGIAHIFFFYDNSTEWDDYGKIINPDDYIIKDDDMDQPPAEGLGRETLERIYERLDALDASAIEKNACNLLLQHLFVFKFWKTVKDGVYLPLSQSISVTKMDSPHHHRWSFSSSPPTKPSNSRSIMQGTTSLMPPTFSAVTPSSTCSSSPPPPPFSVTTTFSFPRSSPLPMFSAATPPSSL